MFQFEEREFAELEEALLPICKPTPYSMFGKTVYSSRISCIYVPGVNEAVKLANSKSSFNYKKTPMYTWEDAPPTIAKIREELKDIFGIEFDYVLVNLYRTRKDSLGFHNDEEAMTSDIASVSLGMSRRFRLRPYGDKKGYTHEYILNSGDVFYMKGPNPAEGLEEGCQTLYKHGVPKMNIGDLKTYMEKRGIALPKGRKTYEAFDKILGEEHLSLSRINLTFRMYE